MEFVDIGSPLNDANHLKLAKFEENIAAIKISFP